MHKVRFNDTHQLNAILFNPNWVLMTTCLPTKAHRFLKISEKCHTANLESLMLYEFSRILSTIEWKYCETLYFKMQFQNGDKGPHAAATTYRPNFSDEDVMEMVEVGIISRELGEKLSRAKVEGLAQAAEVYWPLIGPDWSRDPEYLALIGCFSRMHLREQMKLVLGCQRGHRIQEGKKLQQEDTRL